MTVRIFCPSTFVTSSLAQSVLTVLSPFISLSLFISFIPSFLSLSLRVLIVVPEEDIDKERLRFSTTSLCLCFPEAFHPLSPPPLLSPFSTTPPATLTRVLSRSFPFFSCSSNSAPSLPQVCYSHHLAPSVSIISPSVPLPVSPKPLLPRLPQSHRHADTTHCREDETYMLL